jgi:hypothetical protein
MPAQYKEHALTGTPFMFPAQSLQPSGACVALIAIGVIFAVIDAARMLLDAGPNTKDRISNTKESRPKTAVII